MVKAQNKLLKKLMMELSQYKIDRYIISTTIIIGGETIEVDMGISDRKDMRYPIIIGRKPIKKHFIVDVSKKFINT